MEASTVERLRKFVGKYDCPDGIVDEAADELEATLNEKARICRAIGNYAAHAPLDLKSAREIQSDLFAICGSQHLHQASIGSDECNLCGHDLRHVVHTRWKAQQTTSAKRLGAAE